MKIYLAEESVSIEWNDRGDSMTVNIHGVMTMASDQDLRNLYACLDFLFSKPGGPGA